MLLISLTQEGLEVGIYGDSNILTFFEKNKNFCRPKAPIVETLQFHILS